MDAEISCIERITEDDEGVEEAVRAIEGISQGACHHGSLTDAPVLALGSGDSTACSLSSLGTSSI